MTKHIKYRIETGGPLQARLIGVIASLYISLPTSALLWLATNEQLALWADGTFIGARGFWLVLGIFTLIALILPNLFPTLLGKVWRAIIKLELWF